MHRGQNESTRRHTDVVPVDAVLPLPGVSKVGTYDYESGEVVPPDS